MSPKPSKKETWQQQLLSWYDTHQRPLPWRKTRDPYAIWLSEIMAQQTQVTTVITYWERFLAKWPTVYDLAKAPQDDVLALWSGLGYYARARNLHACAQQIVTDHNGVFPADFEALCELKGIGKYTAGAIGSIALGLPVPVVDGNVARVFCRVMGWQVGVEDAIQKSWEIAESLVVQGQSGNWNQALMELGATVCTPGKPHCEKCPIQKQCRALQVGEQELYPLPKKRVVKKKLLLAAVCFRTPHSVLMVQQTEQKLFQGLWQLPLNEYTENPLIQALSIAQDYTNQKKPDVRLMGHVAVVLTHKEVSIQLYECLHPVQKLPQNAEWIAFSELSKKGMSSMMVKVLQAAHIPLEEGFGRRKKTLLKSDASTLSLFPKCSV